MLSVIGLDADDTLWQNERYYRAAEAEFAALLADFADPPALQERVDACHRTNMGIYGVGAKSFTLTLIEAAIDVSDGVVSADVLRKIVEVGRELLAHPIELLPHAREVVETLSAEGYRIVLITKGDLFHQERKIAASLLDNHFDAVEIVSEKRPETYNGIFARHGAGAASAMMVGNSLKSDIIPAITAGAWGVYVPHEQTWALEHAEPPESAPRYRKLAHLGELPALAARIAVGAG
ncbi:MAG TPA: HAD family hydrolase [Parvularcula sp.]|nr:HAD family hydrolase [Parvularcula sp.]HBS31097.1 HAD family hydrolase [Parvularcula sp.]HBS33838.1 HAD family hydrolase [Parvularcula sp.]